MTSRHVPTLLTAALAALAAASLATQAAAQNAPGSAAETAAELSLEQRTALRCSAAFALVTSAQANGEAQQFPPIAERGREFFVRSAANIMDETGVDRASIAELMQLAVAEFESPQDVEAAMPACLLLLDASGL